MKTTKVVKIINTARHHGYTAKADKVEQQSNVQQTVELLNMPLGMLLSGLRIDSTLYKMTIPKHVCHTSKGPNLAHLSNLLLVLVCEVYFFVVALMLPNQLHSRTKLCNFLLNVGRFH